MGEPHLHRRRPAELRGRHVGVLHQELARRGKLVGPDERLAFAGRMPPESGGDQLVGEPPDWSSAREQTPAAVVVTAALERV